MTRFVCPICNKQALPIPKRILGKPAIVLRMVEGTPIQSYLTHKACLKRVAHPEYDLSQEDD